MQDNIGMCAQGNLSRLCNILSGYMDGLDLIAKSRNQLVGERFALLRNIEDEQKRAMEGYRILHELKVPDDEWMTWIENL
jgi:hypothetical protein